MSDIGKYEPLWGAWYDYTNAFNGGYATVYEDKSKSWYILRKN